MHTFLRQPRNVAFDFHDPLGSFQQSIYNIAEALIDKIHIACSMNVC